jgi:hypothetical protein
LDDLKVLENTEHDRADKSESKIRGHDTELADVRTENHRKPPEVTPVVRFQHSHSFATGSFANAEIKGPRENIGFQWSFG